MDMKGFFQNVALAQQSARAEQNRKALVEIKSELRSQKEKASEQHQLKQRMFRWRQMVQEAIAIEKPIQRCLALIELKERDGWLDISEVEQLADKQWHTDTQSLLFEAFSIVQNELDNETIKALYTIRNAFKNLKESTYPLIELSNYFEKKRPKSADILKWNEMLENISHTLNDAEQYLEDTPKEIFELIPLEKLIKSIKTDILDAASLDIFRFKCLVLVAKADGKIEKSEVKLLKKVGKEFLITKENIDSIINETDSIQKSDFTGNKKTAEQIARELYQCALVDGSVDEMEEQTIYDISQKIGVPSEILDNIFGRDRESQTKQVIIEEKPPHEINSQKNIPDDGINRNEFYAKADVVDKDKLRKFFLDSFDNKQKSEVHLGNSIPNDSLEALSDVCSLQSSEIPIILVIPNIIGFKKSRILVSNYSLYLFNLFTKNKCEKILISDVLSFKPGKFMGGKIQAKGMSITTPQVMNRIFDALINAIIASKL
jgi:tellurite resistance protein